MTPHIVIIGGGASGTLLAAHLLRSVAATSQHVRITLVEKCGEFGRGLAYSTHQACHVLNVRAQNMSAFPDDPEHFLRWLEQNGRGKAEPGEFVARGVYGQYLSELVASPQSGVRLHTVHQECVGISPRNGGVEVSLSDGSVLAAHHAVLATGFCQNAAPDNALENPWCGLQVTAPSKAVLLIGTGLTMIDKVLSYLNEGHKAPIYAMSRRGLLPQTHRATHPMKLSAADIPMGTSLTYSMRALRNIIRAHELAGGDWRDVVDGLRPHTQTLWRHLPSDSRRRFLRHLSTMWDVHRHRMPPQSAQKIADAQASGILRIIKGRLLEARKVDEGVTVTYRPSGGAEVAQLTAARAFDCRGFPRLRIPSDNILIQSLVDQQIARPDDLHLGLDFDWQCALVNGMGHASDVISGIGPITRGIFWESTAIPDIRVQAAQLAERLIVAAFERSRGKVTLPR